MSKRAVTRPAINKREAQIIRRIRGKIKLLGGHLKRATGLYVSIGSDLARCKKDQPPGKWMEWTYTNFALSHDTAERWIALAHRMKTDARFRTLRNLPVTVLYALDRQPELIDPILQRHASGERITPRTLRLNFFKTIEEPATAKVPVTVIEPGERRTARVPHGVPAELPVYTPPSSLLSPSRPSLRPPEWLCTPTAFFEAMAAVLPLPDTLVLAEAYRTKPPKVSVDQLRELSVALGKLVSILSADSTPTETPPEGGWRH